MAAAAATEALTLYRRNAVSSHARYANIETLADSKRLITSNRLWEIDKAALADDVSPDWIAESTRELVNDLLNQADRRGVALDWNSVRSHIFDGAPDTNSLILRVDVLQ
jgi:hypothetical protein